MSFIGAKAQNKDIILEEIIVNEKSKTRIHTPEFFPDSSIVAVPRTTGELFKAIPGFTVTKRSGFAIEPGLRMYRNEQLKLMLDGGTQITQSCANRMDPMTTRISAGEIEKIQIIKGPYSVRYGQSFGGIINVISQRPQRSEKFKLKGSYKGGYEFNGNGIYSSLTLQGGESYVDFILNGSYRDYNNYTSGEGNEILSSFKAYDYSAKLGINPTEHQRVQLSWRQSFAKDVLHAGLPMDAKDDFANSLSVDYAWKPAGEKLQTINAQFYGSQVDHLMTNEWKATVKNTLAIANVFSETYGAKVEVVTKHKNKTFFYTGFDLKHLSKDGQRNRTLYINPCTGAEFNPVKSASDLIWQNSTNQTYGAFAETQFLPNKNMEIKAGLRVDFVNLSIDNPAADFEALYANNLQPANHTTYNAFANLNYKISENSSLQISIGKGSRSPDLLELFINHLSVGKDVYEYVGNPKLKPENNLQTDLGFITKRKNYMLFANVFYTNINNYITAMVDESLPRKFMPCKEPEFAKRFVNVDEVFQYGFEFGFNAKLYSYFRVYANVNYTFAENKELNEPVAEIPPLMGNLKINYLAEKLKIGISSHFAAKQNRVAESFNESETDAYKVFNFDIQYKLLDLMTLGLGVENILNETYYEHLSRPYKNLSEKSEYYEVGRNVKLSLKVNF